MTTAHDGRQLILRSVFFIGLSIASLLAYDIATKEHTMYKLAVLTTLASSINGALGGWSSWALTTQTSPSVVQPSTSAAAPSTPSTTSSADSATYTNPILKKVGADPWVVRDGDYYYMTYTTSDNVTLLRSSVLTFVLTSHHKARPLICSQRLELS